MKWSIAVLGLLLSGGSYAAEKISPAADLDKDLVTFYAKDALLTEQEARQRLNFQSLAGDLESKIADQDWFAGLYIEHQPAFKIHVLRSGPSGDLKSLSTGPLAPLAPHLVVTDVVYSMNDLQEQAAAALHAFRQAGVKADLDIDVKSNSIRVSSPDKSTLVDRLNKTVSSFPRNIYFVEAPLSIPLFIPGGVSLGNCTSGFGLINPSGTRAISTAGHCHNAPQFYGGLQLPLGIYKAEGEWDVAWYSPRTFTPTNQIWNGTDYLSITSIRASGSQTIGEVVCKQGRLTGTQCGYIRSKTIAPNYLYKPSPTFIALGSSSMLGQQGDSGGPVWRTTIAYGMISGLRVQGGENQIVYMSADRVFPAIGYYILVTP